MKKIDILAALALLPVCGYVFYEAGSWPKLPDLGDPGWIPRGVAACLLAATLILMIRALRGGSLMLTSRLQGKDRNRVLWVAAITMAYVAVVSHLGFIASTALYMGGFGIALGERRTGRIAFFAAVVPGVIYLVFDVTLNVPLPHGWLF